MHEFAFFFDTIYDQQVITVQNPSLYHRMVHVLRMHVGDVCMFFNKQYHAHARIESIEKKKIIVWCFARTANPILLPHITVLLPILKKGALADAVYNLVEVGVNEIQLVMTQRTTHTWYESETHRLEECARSAAEQSKVYHYADIKEPISLSSYKPPVQATFFLADIQGESVKAMIEQCADVGHIGITFGPEAGFTEEEREQLRIMHFIPIRLTPTIIRSVQVGAFMAGMLRAWRSS